MNNKIMIILSVTLLTSLIPIVYGDYLNLENTILTGETSKFDAELFLQFGENHDKNYIPKKK